MKLDKWELNWIEDYNLSFLNGIKEEKKEERIALENRKKREKVLGFSNAKKWGEKFLAGDILRISIDRGPFSFIYEGICLNIKKSNLYCKDTSLLLRNVLSGVNVEVIGSYYYNRLYKSFFNDYKRKEFFYLSKKLYYLRERVNNRTKVRSRKVR